MRSSVPIFAYFKRMNDSSIVLDSGSLGRMIGFVEDMKFRSGDSMGHDSFGIANIDDIDAVLEDDDAEEGAS